MTKKPDEAELIEKIKNGDSAAFESLFDFYWENLLNFAYSYVNSRPTAQDIVQEVFVRIWKNRENLIVSATLKSYLFTAIKNQALKYLRHEKVKQKADDIPNLNQPIATPEELVDAGETLTAIQQAVNKLPTACRNIFRLSRYDELTYSEIADALGLSVNTVRAQMGRAFASIRKHLSSKGL